VRGRGPWARTLGEEHHGAQGGGDDEDDGVVGEEGVRPGEREAVLPGGGPKGRGGGKGRPWDKDFRLNGKM